MNLEATIVDTFVRANGHLFDPPLAEKIRQRIHFGHLSHHLTYGHIDGRFCVEERSVDAGFIIRKKDLLKEAADINRQIAQKQRVLEPT